MKNKSIWEQLKLWVEKFFVLIGFISLVDLEDEYRNASDERQIDLIFLGVDVATLRDVDGNPPLHWARSEKLARLLIAKGVDINIRGRGGLTALHFNSNINIIKLLVEEGAEVNERDNIGRTPLHYKRDPESIRFLVANGAQIDAKDDLQQTVAFFVGADAIQTLADLGLDLNIQDYSRQTALHYAISDSFSDVVSKLLQNGANPNIQDAYGNTPLHCYGNSIRCSEDITRALLRFDADLSITNNEQASALHYAAMHCDLNLVKECIASGIDVEIKDYIGRTPLHYLVLYSNPHRTQEHLRYNAQKVIQELLKNGACIDSKEREGQTPFDLAVNRYIKQYLSEVKSNFETLRNAVESGRSDIVQDYLSQFFVDLDAIDACGETLLHVAALYGHLETVRVLLNCGAKPNIKTVATLEIPGEDEPIIVPINDTPLHLAAKRGFKEIYELLIARGADTTIENNQGYTPKDYYDSYAPEVAAETSASTQARRPS